MWATPGRYQATTIGRLRSLSWLQCKDSKNTGWLANTCDNELVGISWVDGTSDSCSELKERGNLGLARNACVYKSCFNLKGHSKEVHVVVFCLVLLIFFTLRSFLLDSVHKETN